jgi:hypothetical protein
LIPSILEMSAQLGGSVGGRNEIPAMPGNPHTEVLPWRIGGEDEEDLSDRPVEDFPQALSDERPPSRDRRLNMDGVFTHIRIR